MPKQANPLTAAKVKTAPPGPHCDGGGLILNVEKSKPRPDGTVPPDPASWIFRFTSPSSGKRRDAGLGPARGPDAVSLAYARESRRRMRERLREGKDPLDEREAEKKAAAAVAAKAAATAMTFAQVAALYIAAYEASWRNAKHRQQWRNTLRDYVLPAIGELPVRDVDTGAVVRIIEPLWREKTATASRVRGRIESILDYGKVRGWRDGENPARWRGHLDHLLPKQSKVQRVDHHAALDWRELAPFMARLCEQPGAAALALRFAMLTVCRTNEVLGARWDEVSIKDRVWTIPEGSRTKNHQELRVPLSIEAMDVLAPAAQLAGGSEYLFPNDRGRQLEGKAMWTVVSRMGIDATVHGTCRACFKTWCGETGKPHDLSEAALNHTQGKLNEAYQRGDLLQRRRVLMQAWAEFLKQSVGGDNVVALHGEAEAAA
jgi:integrase